MATIFTRIIRGEIPCYKIAENDRYFAFLDIAPKAEGHTLVIPKMEVDYLFDLDDELLTGMILFAKNLANAIRSACPCEKVGMAVLGLEVPHAHIHLIPLQSEETFYRKEKINLSPENFEAIAKKIRSFI